MSDRYKLLVGDCREKMLGIPDCSIDAIVTDPPYELGFMGKAWDSSGIAYDPAVWSQCLRVLKPGGHLLAFGGTRTFHRMVCAIEDVGFEVRDMIEWVYGSGFPKSHDVSKAIDKMDAAEEQERRRLRFTAWVRSHGVTSRQIDDATGTNMGGHYTTAASQPAIMTREHLEACRHLFGDVPKWVEIEADKRSVESANFKMREVVGQKKAGMGSGETFGMLQAEGRNAFAAKEVAITAPATDAAREWHGWGTALKPAHEPITLCRKPLVGTVAANVMEWRTGALHVDACRVEGPGNKTFTRSAGNRSREQYRTGTTVGNSIPVDSGRWPANFIHDGSDEATAPLGNASRFFYCAKASKRDRNNGCEGVMTWEGVDLSREMESLSQLARAMSDDTIQAMESPEWSIAPSGSPSMGLYQTDTRYITSTVSEMITVLRTCNSSTDSRTRDCILGAICKMENGSSLAESAECISKLMSATTSERMASALGAVGAVLKTLSRIRGRARLGNGHSTVKPTELMRYLVRLVTPPGGVILDPFAGSGSTGKAAMLEGFRFVGVELDAKHAEIAEARIKHAH